MELEGFARFSTFTVALSSGVVQFTCVICSANACVCYGLTYTHIQTVSAARLSTDFRTLSMHIHCLRHCQQRKCALCSFYYRAVCETRLLFDIAAASICHFAFTPLLCAIFHFFASTATKLCPRQIVYIFIICFSFRSSTQKS
jgi:hypothetical protein